MRNPVPMLLAATAMIVTAGFVEGYWTNRWGMSRELSSLADRLDRMVATVPGWSYRDSRLSDRELALAGADGHFTRLYTRNTDGARVTILLLGGLPKDIAAHTPEVCYPGAGYELDSPQRVGLTCAGDAAAVLLSACARSSTPGATPLRIYWSWDDGAGWNAPEDPRWSYAGRRALCKLYAVEETAADAADPAATPAAELLRSILPELSRALFGDTPAAPAH